MRISQGNADDVIGSEVDEPARTKIRPHHAPGHGLCVRIPEGECTFRIGVLEAHGRPPQLSAGGREAACHRSRRIPDGRIQTPDHLGEYG
ncbi:hypothetical protein ACW9HJ_07810 [Nocardia gipuzkoensis]